MFSGIVEKTGRVTRWSLSEGTSARAVIATGFNDLSLGESVAINGTCLTVAELAPESQGDGCAEFYISEETLKRTNLHTLAAGKSVNLERALTLSTRLSGHLVQGHVDATGALKSRSSRGENWELAVEVPPDVARYLVEKGSIALNGVSLTINSVERCPGGEAIIKLMIIPHTWRHTNLSEVSLGELVNIEIDVLAKYVEQLCRPYSQPSMP